MRTLLLPLCLALTACASTETPSADRTELGSASTADAELVCRTVKRVGSHRRTQVCKTPDEIEEERRDAREAMEGNVPGSQPPGVPPVAGGGGG